MPLGNDISEGPGDGLDLLVAGRLYGEAREPDHLSSVRRMPVPPAMQALQAALEAQSRVLALAPDAEREAVYDAFGHDLALLIRYRDAFKKTVDAAVRARAPENDKTARAHLEPMTEQISEIVYEPTLDLGPEAVALDPNTLRARLQEQFRADAASLVRNVATWLHILAEGDFVSVIEWFNPHAIRYHFFRLETQRRELDRTRRQTGDAMRGRTITTTTTTRTDLFSERRVHTLVNTRVHRPDAYAARVPRRIAALLDDIPVEVKPFVTIIDGTVSQEEVHRRLADSKVETVTKSVFIPDPALALFDSWAINGWGGSSPEPARSLYREHKLSKANRYLAIEAAGTIAATILGAIAEGRRGAVVLALICIILAGFQQVGMRIPAARPSSS